MNDGVEYQKQLPFPRYKFPSQQCALVLILWDSRRVGQFRVRFCNNYILTAGD